MGTKSELTAVALKGALWETLQDVKRGVMEPSTADAVASQAREIIRTARLQLQISKQARVEVPAELVQFASPAAK